MRRKAILLSSILFLCGITDLDAQGVLKESFNTDEFPEVSFVWHEFNPEVISLSEFQGITENGKPVEFVVKNVPQSLDETEDRYVVFLWEDLDYHGKNLYNFSRNTLAEFIGNADFGKSDKINISVYGRRGINDSSYLRDLTGGFVSDVTVLQSAVSNYTRNTAKYKDFPNRTDIFPAVSEAIEMLRKTEKGVKSVVVLTAGYPLDNSSASSDMHARLLSEKYHIPVYFLQYGRDHGYSDKLSSFAPLTYGTFHCFSNIDQNKNVRNAVDTLDSIYASMAKRYHGQDYLIAYTSNAKRNDDSCLLEFRINGYEYKELMMPPSRSLGAFIRNHTLLAILLLVTILGLLALAIIFYVRRRMHDDKRFRKLDEQSRVNNEKAVSALKAISDTRYSYERKIRTMKSDMTKSNKEELAALLAKKSIYPRLVCNVNGDVITYIVTRVSTSIGRDASNDMVIADNRVSRRHARLVFTGYSFVIEDNGSMNGVSLNGNKINKSAVVQSADKIDLGGILITIYF